MTEQGSWAVVRSERDIHVDGSTSEWRAVTVFDCAMAPAYLAMATDVADEVFAAMVTQARAHQEAYVDPYVQTVSYALDYRRADGPNGPARRLTREITVGIVGRKPWTPKGGK